MVCDVLQEDECVGCSSSADQASSCPGFHNSKIPEMGSVVATITGYSGDEKPNLIKLINSSGGYYVGKLSKGLTTHLVCWTFDGPKYEMAKRFGIYIINHRFFEESLREGRRLSESPYTKLSGKQVGAVLWKPPKQEINLLQHVKLGRPKTYSKYACKKSYLPNSVMGEGFCEAAPDSNIFSPVELRRTLSEEILDFSDEDQDLQILLKSKPPKKGDKGKRKASLVLKNQSPRHKKVAKKSIVSPSHAGQRKHGDMRNRVSHSILEYVYIADETDADDNHSTPKRARKSLATGIPAEHTSPDIWGSSRNPIKFPQLEFFEECYPAPSRSAYSREQKQKSLSILDSMRQRKKQRLVRKTGAVSPVCAFDGVVAVAIDMAQPQSSVVTDCPSPILSESGRTIFNLRHPQYSQRADGQSITSFKAASRTEILNEEPASPNTPPCDDAPCFMACENLSKSPVACTLVPADIACVICHTDHINSAEGVLSCGHCFCYQCIKKWASEVASKTPTCPLCKAPFDMITKREQKIGLDDDEEISYEECVVLLGCGEKCSSQQFGDSTPSLACIMCGIGDMEELLLTCSGCGMRSAHSFCLDPPLPPVPNTSWFCGRCSQRRRADTTWWHQLHLFEGLQD